MWIEEIRKPAVAGRFYSDVAEQLQKNVEQLLLSEEPNLSKGTLRAVIVPHAGYVFSGKVAAAGFRQISRENPYRNVFIIGSSHNESFHGASVYDGLAYRTPLGDVPINREIVEELYDSMLFNGYRSAHELEHTIEVQLPFLQVQQKNDFKIVPILLGTHSIDECKGIAEVLRPYFNKDNLFVISTDFSHYPNYKDAYKQDEQTARVILQNDVKKLGKLLVKQAEATVSGMRTGLCGWTSVLSLLNLTQVEQNLRFDHLMYLNSGDSTYGDKMRVVGYHAIAVYEEEQGRFALSDKEKECLLHQSYQALWQTFGKRYSPVKEIEKVELQSGAFVSIYCDGKLRGCLGHFQSTKKLPELISELTVSAATQDVRFDPIQEDELDDVKIEISVLTPMKKIKTIKEIELGRHGIYLSKGGKAGTFLPQVASKQGWSVEETLGHCARDKARIGWEGWKDAEIYVYEAIVFSDL